MIGLRGCDDTLATPVSIESTGVWYSGFMCLGFGSRGYLVERVHGILWRRRQRRGPRRVSEWKTSCLPALGIGAGPPDFMFAVWGLGFGV